MKFDLNYKLTQNFTLSEFICTSSPSFKKSLIDQINNSERVLCLKMLCTCLLQPIRDQFGRIKISSGFRTAHLNFQIGGHPNSDHLNAAAADFFGMKGNDLQDTYKWIQEKKLPYRNLIYYPKRRFIHISINTPYKEDKNIAFIKED